jgi:hypothetical protein
MGISAILPGPLAWARLLLAAAVAGVVMGVLGPLGSYEAEPGPRIFYCIWVALIGTSIIVAGVSVAVWAGRRAGWPAWTSSLAVAPVLSLAAALLFRIAAPLLWLGAAPATGPFWPDYLVVLMVVAAASPAVAFLLQRRARPAALADNSKPALLARLPASVGEDVLALQAEDHYVRVHTARGSALLSMRFADAIAGLDGLDGLRIHRSWWVARSAVRAARADGRRVVLDLSNGLSVKATREASSRLRRAHWL